MIHRRYFLEGLGGASLALAALGTGVGCRSDLSDRSGGEGAVRSGLSELSVAEIQRRMAAGKLTSERLARHHLRRIEQIDRSGPRLNAVIELNPDALAMARALDEERRTRGPRGPLHGVTVLLKDNLATADRMQTTAGSLALSGSVAPRDAFVVARLRAAGAVVLGKTNLSEWANFRGHRSISGWSARGGLTRNPHQLDRSASGSSSGSGAAVAADLCTVAVGTETDGSIVSPASACGIVGLKPTVGLVSRSGIIPISSSQDTAGPMARTVADAAVLLGAMTGIDPSDPASAGSEPASARHDFTRFLDPNALKGARLGVARNFFGWHRRIDALMEMSLAILRAQGAELIDVTGLPGHSTLGDAEYEVMLHEFKAGLNAYLASLGESAPVKSLAEVIAFNERNADRELRFFGQETLLEAQRRGPLTDPRYLEALARCRRWSRQEGIDRVMDRDRLDALVAPTAGPAPAIELLEGDGGLGGSSTHAAVAGYPSITVPAGLIFGLPVGLSFFGRAWSEGRLIGFAHAFEIAAQARRTPRFLPSFDERMDG
jgi:amidase